MKKILIVDDEPNIVMSLEYTFKKNNYQVFIARDGQEALDIVKTNFPDVIILDIMMPGMDGYEATKRIRNTKSLSEIPIIAVTAKAMKGDRETSLSNGLNEHITKPIEGAALINLLNNFFQ